MSADFCGYCGEFVDRDYLNDAGECHDCATHNFADWVRDFPYTKGPELDDRIRVFGFGRARAQFVATCVRREREVTA